MAAAVNNLWMAPLGYFIIDGLSGSARVNLVSECLIRLNESGVKIISVTCIRAKLPYNHV